MAFFLIRHLFGYDKWTAQYLLDSDTLLHAAIPEMIQVDLHIRRLTGRQYNFKPQY